MVKLLLKEFTGGLCYRFVINGLLGCELGVMTQAHVLFVYEAFAHVSKSPQMQLLRPNLNRPLITGKLLNPFLGVSGDALR